MGDYLAPAISGLFGVFAGICAQWWRSSRDELRFLCEDFCKLISETAELGAIYWATTEGLPEKEARLQGFQRRITGYNVIVGEQLHDRAVDEIDLALIRFFDALTGGTFSEPSRATSLDHVRRCHDAAADAILAVRQGFVHTVRLREKLWRATVGRARPDSTWHSTFGRLGSKNGR